jgi:hypothetical protein
MDKEELLRRSNWARGLSDMMTGYLSEEALSLLEKFFMLNASQAESKVFFGK